MYKLYNKWLLANIDIFYEKKANNIKTEFMGLLPQFMGMVLELLKNAKRHFKLLCTKTYINNFIKVDDILFKWWKCILAFILKKIAWPN